MCSKHDTSLDRFKEIQHKNNIQSLKKEWEEETKQKVKQERKIEKRRRKDLKKLKVDEYKIKYVVA